MLLAVDFPQVQLVSNWKCHKNNDLHHLIDSSHMKSKVVLFKAVLLLKHLAPIIFSYQYFMAIHGPTRLVICSLLGHVL